MKSYIFGFIAALLITFLNVSCISTTSPKVTAMGMSGGSLTQPPTTWSLFPALQNITSEGSNIFTIGTTLQPFKTAYFTESVTIAGQSALTNEPHSEGFSNILASTSMGSEGFRHIGALGGYTLEEFIEDTSLKGVARDMPTFIYTQGALPDRNVSWTDGDVYDPATGYHHINSNSIVLVDNANNFAYWSISNPNTILWTTGTRADITNNVIPITSFAVSLGRILHNTPAISIGDMPLRMDDAHYQLFPSIIKEGLNFAPIGTNFNEFIQVGGVEVHNMIEDNAHPSKNFLTNTNPLTGNYINNYFHTNSVSWGSVRTNLIDVTQYDNGTNLVPCVTSNWYRGLFMSGAKTRSVAWIYPTAAYTNYADALAADDPTPPSGFEPYIPRCTAYIFQGNDTELRLSSDYWIDRRFMIRRGTMTIGGGASSTPSLFQVLTVGHATGGIIPDGLGLPSADDQAANKAYVDQSVNNINSHTAYVDENGSDATALLESSIRPFKTIQAAINAASVVAADTNRYIISISPGMYVENVSMSNYIGLVGVDIESTKIVGNVTYPHEYTDILGAEIGLLTIASSNVPAVSIDCGSDLAYVGLRSCYLVTLYDNDSTYKTVVQMNRGIAELYATTYCELIIAPTNGEATVSEGQIFEHTTDLANEGLSTFTAFGMSGVITCNDTNDNINFLFTHDNTDTRCINTTMGSSLNMYLNDNPNHVNKIKIVSHDTAVGRTFSQGTVLRAYLHATNDCNLFFGYSKDGPAENVSIIRGNHVRIIGAATSNVWLGAATSTNDGLRVYDSVYINNYADYPYPKIYTNDGSLGKYFINTVTESGGHLFGGYLDISAINVALQRIPDVGHLRIQVDNSTGLENLYVVDSAGNNFRQFRDTIFTRYNAETNTLQVGEPVIIWTNTAGTAHYIKRANAANWATMPCRGIVCDVGGIPAGTKGRVMVIGCMEQSMDTTMWKTGEVLYVSTTNNANGIKLTNVKPTGTNIAQEIGIVNTVATNGYLTINIQPPDTIGVYTFDTLMGYIVQFGSNYFYSVSNPSEYLTGTTGSNLFYTVGNTNNYISGSTASNLFMSSGSGMAELSMTNKTQTITDGEGFAIITNWSSNVQDTNFVNTTSNITTGPVVTRYLIHMDASFSTASAANLEMHIYTNNVVATDAIGNTIGWAVTTPAASPLTVVTSSRLLTVAANTRISVRVDAIGATEIITWETATFRLEKK